MEDKKLTSNHSSRAKTIVALCLCVLLAFVMWVYVMAVESPEYEHIFSNITVQIEGTDKISDGRLAVYSGYGNMIDITVAGKRSVVSKLTESDIEAYVNVAGQASSGRYNLDIMVDLPAGCKLVSKSQNTMAVYLDLSQDKSVTLSERRENSNLPENCFTGEIELDVDKVTLTGPSMALARVQSAVVTFDMSGVTKSTELTGTVSLIDQNGNKLDAKNITYSPTEVTVFVPVYKTVEVPLMIEFRHGFLSYDNTSVTISPSSVEVTGDAELIDGGNLIDAIVIDEKTSFESGRFNRVVSVDVTDPELTVSNYQAEVNIELNPSFGTRTFVIDGESITPENINEGVEITWPHNDMEVTLLGKREILNALTTEDITVSFDMMPFSSSNSGTIRIKADIGINPMYENDVIAVGSYSINVKFVNERTEG